MSYRILLVDDDPLTLRGCRHALERWWTVDTAGNGTEGLKAVTDNGPYAAIIADLHMPDMTGLALLIEARRLAPTTVRLMLTGVNDAAASIDAINAGRVFRFLKKPCPLLTLATAAQEAVQEHQRLVREHAALDQTCTGIVNLLAHVLAEIDPAAVTAGQHLAERIKELGIRLNLPATREIEVAALLLRVGLVGLPVTVNAKLRGKKPLTAGEADTLRRLPEIGAHLLALVPQLEAVAEMVRYQEKGFDGVGQPADAVRGEKIPLGARLLHPLIEMRTLENEGMTSTQAVQKMQRHATRFDPQVFHALTTLADEWTVRGHRRLEARLISELHEGMELERDVVTEDGFRIAAAGTKLTEPAIERLRNFAEQGRIRDTVYVVIDDTPVTASPIASVLP